MIGRWMIGLLALIAPGAVVAQIPADAPELAARGSAPVGTQSLVLTDPDRFDVMKPDGAGRFKHGARTLTIEIWYPAVAAAKSAQHITYTMPAPFLGGRKSDPNLRLSFSGNAARGAAPAAGRFPLVVLSHGYNNRAVGFSDLAENLASKGYVVVAIEHGDVDPAKAGSPRASFLQVLVDR
ncbi:MAG: dienelactone hydrolase, partial [Pseudomonadota bacterium]|nr:dienelactone hydrolase [Pseudomonadota bacterium]